MAVVKRDRKIIEDEYYRMGFNIDSKWRISDINKDFELCNTYPRFLIIPSAFKDEDLESVAKFRYFRRIPTAVWRNIKNGCFIVRSSQPTVGWFGWFRNELDENLVQSYVNNTISLSSSSRFSPSSPATGDSTSVETSDANVTTIDQKLSGSKLSDKSGDCCSVGSRKGLNARNRSKIDAHTNGDSCSFSVESSDRLKNQVIKQQLGDSNSSESKNNQRHQNNDTIKCAINRNVNENSHSESNDNSEKIINIISKSLLGDIENATELTTMIPNKRPASNETSTHKSSTHSKIHTTCDTKNLNPQSQPEASSENGVNKLEIDNTPLGSSDSTADHDATTKANTTADTDINTDGEMSDDDSNASKILIIDARSYTAAMANRAKGGGCECSEYYRRCEVHFMSLANIHSIRKSYHAIRNVCEAYSEQSNNWLSFLDSSKWLDHISGLLRSALLVVDTIDIEEKSVMIHCSDGWDRTAQLVALAEIMLDSHYRTMDGFRTLIQREWLDFGHKFADRCGSNPCNEDPNERCPVFLQWLDCVQQLLVQFPRHFEFNAAYLDKLNRHTYSNVFGTFAYNSSQERSLNKIEENSPCLWTYFESCRDRYRNEDYVKSDEVLRPSYKVRDLCFWKEVYLPPIRSNQLSLGSQTTPITLDPTLPASTQQSVTSSTTVSGNNTGIDSSKCCDSLHLDGPSRTVCK